MRKAGKKRIAAATRQYEKWRAGVDSRLLAIHPDAMPILSGWADDVRGRIENGDLGVCTEALIRSVIRVIEDFEVGRYVGVTGDSGFQCAGHLPNRRDHDSNP